MIVTILQPSYLPWRGYFLQILKSDIFVFYDDVQYDKHGWRNRNRIKTSNGVKWITIPVHSSGNIKSNLLIKDVEIDWSRSWNKVHWQMIKQNYCKCPFFDENMDWVEGFFQTTPKKLSDFSIATTMKIAEVLGISGKKFVRSSELSGISGSKTERLISILTLLNATKYLSGPSAKCYIESELFRKAGIELQYIDYRFAEYPQRFPPFEPNLSIVDLIFNVGIDSLQNIKSSG